MGISCDGPVLIEGDNQSALANTSIPESTLKKKCQIIAYHLVREGVARDEWRTAYIRSTDIEADLLTKILPSGEKMKGFVRNILHHTYREKWTKHAAETLGAVHIKSIFTTELFNETEFFSLINDDVEELFFSEFDKGYFCQVCSGCSHDD